MDVKLLLLNVLFAILAVVSLAAYNVARSLWWGMTEAVHIPWCSNISTATRYQPTLDPYFILSFSSLSYFIIFGLVTLGIFVVQSCINVLAGRRVVGFLTFRDNLLFPQWQLVLIGVLNAIGGTMYLFSSAVPRTSPFVQALLGNFSIPLTIFFRFVLLRKSPTILKLLCALAVFGAVLFSNIPVSYDLINGYKIEDRFYLRQSLPSKILWPLCLVFSFIPLTVAFVIMEKSLKDTKRVNFFYFFMWTSFYQLLTVSLLFFVDIIPHVGYADSLKHLGKSYKFGLQCFFGSAGCSYVPGFMGSVSFFGFFLSSVGIGGLLRYTEGATYLAMVQSLWLPLNAYFWSIFGLDGCANLIYSPHGNKLAYFSIAGMVIMVPAIVLYNIGSFTEVKRLLRGGGDRQVFVNAEDIETTPLIARVNS